MKKKINKVKYLNQYLKLIIYIVKFTLIIKLLTTCIRFFILLINRECTIRYDIKYNKL